MSVKSRAFFSRMLLVEVSILSFILHSIYSPSSVSMVVSVTIFTDKNVMHRFPDSLWYNNYWSSGVVYSWH
jgi:hypothetical protein